MQDVVVRKNRFKVIKNIILILYFLVLDIILVGSFYLKIYFSGEPIDEMMFYLNNGVGNSNMDVLYTAIRVCLPYCFAILVLLFILFDIFNIKYKKIKVKEKEFFIVPFKFIGRHRFIFSIILGLLVIFIAISNLNVFSYLKTSSSDSSFIEKNYKTPYKENINFKKKKNLILINVESLETTLFTKKQGGDWDYEVIPEMYSLLNDKDSIYFSSDKKSAGIYGTSTSNWTTASIFASSSGIPFKVPIDGNSYHSSNFMSGAYTLGDILSDNGYYNEVISAANTNFGGLEEYFTKHGSYNIIDVRSKEKYDDSFKSSDVNHWGFNDNYLFYLAKKRLNEISKDNKPFNLELITIDTHAYDIYLGDYSVNKYDSNVENAYATTSKLIYDFINWVKRQDYYKDTTIVILGDHPSHNVEFFKNYDQDKRRVYNVIINPSTNTLNTKNRRFMMIDMYPTILASIGADIKDDQLGLGVNLFSDKFTLSEIYGVDYVNEELLKKSKFYNDTILAGDYENLVKESLKNENN